MLTYTSAAQIDLTAPIPQVLAAAFGGAGTPTAGLDLGLLLGRFAILALAVGTVAQYAVIIASISRLPMVAAWFTRLHPRYHMPTRSLTFIVVVAVLLCLLASAGAGSQEAFQLLATSGNVCYGVNYLLMLFAVPLVVGRRLAIVQASCCASAASSVWRLLHADRLRSYADCRRQQPGYLASRSGLPHSPRMPSERSCIGAVRARRR
jgi:amino acid transporter